ncbi:MAG: hypothetical protein KJ645_06620 [Planctomycetes bacterium]|nr:hypothetical protein [Planctomycetota bacterium]
MKKGLFLLLCVFALFTGMERTQGGEDLESTGQKHELNTIPPDKAPAPEERPTIQELGVVKEGAGNVFKFTWKLTKPCDVLVVCRGLKQLILLPGDATEFTYEEEMLGYFRYTVALFDEGEWVDYDSLLVESGNICWDPPEGDFSGYYLYITEDTGDPYTTLPYDNPYDYTVDMMIYDRIWLITLYQYGYIENGKRYHVAVSSYLHGCPETVVSGLSEPITFEYHVILDQPVP